MTDARGQVLTLARTHTRPDTLLTVAEAQHQGDILRELMWLGCERAIELAHLEVAPERAKPAPQKHRVSRSRKEGSAYSPPASTGSAIAARLRSVAPAYDWQLPNGSQLGMACAADLDHAIAAHSVKAQAHVGWVKFYSAVKVRLVREKAHTVADVLTAPELRQLKQASGVRDDE